MKLKELKNVSLTLLKKWFLIKETDRKLDAMVVDELFKLPQDKWNLLDDVDKAYLCARTRIQVHKKCIFEAIEKRLKWEEMEILRKKNDLEA